MRRSFVLVVAALLVTLAALMVGRLATSTAATTGPAIRVTPKTSPKPVGAVGETFLTKIFTLSYTGGTVKIAGGPSGSAQVEVDDALVIQVKGLLRGHAVTRSRYPRWLSTRRRSPASTRHGRLVVPSSLQDTALLTRNW